MVYRYFVTKPDFHASDISSKPITLHRYSPKMYESSIRDYIFGYVNYQSPIPSDIAEKFGLRAIA